MPDDPVTAREALLCPHSELALDLTSQAVRLLARDSGGDWAELGAVPLADGDVRSGLDALRRAAKARGSPPVTLWLPPEQILVRHYVLKNGSSDRDEAVSRIAAESGHAAAELTLALSPVSDGGVVTVLAAFRRTVEEAIDYARRWGFRPRAVSTRVEAERFGTAGPVFKVPEAAPIRTARSRIIAVAAASLGLVLGLGAWGAQGLLFSADRAIEAAPEPARAVAATPKATPHHAEKKFALRWDAPSMVGRTRAQPLETPRPRPERPSEELLLPASHAIADVVALPPLGEAAPSDPPARLAFESATAERQPFRHRPEPVLPQAALDLASLMAGIERIRAEGLEDPEQEIVLAASDVALARVPGAVPLPVPRPAPAGATPSDGRSDGVAAYEDVVESEGSDTPAIGGSESRLAALSAPVPPARPVRSKQGKADYRAGAGLPRIGGTASEHGISLEATSLIGVIDARSGREALLRMPSGDFLRVARGDQIAGWRVNAIGQDAMRLTRGGETMTLLLVTR